MLRAARHLVVDVPQIAPMPDRGPDVRCTFDVRDRLGRIEVPVLAIAGAEDPAARRTWSA